MNSNGIRGEKLLKKIHDVYLAVGALILALITVLVTFTVIARYFFGQSWMQLQEFITVCFALSSFWGMGLCVLNNEHIVVDVLIIRMKGKLRRIFDMVSLLVTTVVLAFFTYQSFIYVINNGRQLSYGMRIPMYWLYGIMPVAAVLSLICVLVRWVLWFKNVPNPLDSHDKLPEIDEP